MAAGTRANLADNPAAAEAAFRAALALQQKALGANNPNTATHADDAGAATLRRRPLRRGRQRCSPQAGALAPRAADPTAPARLLHYRGAGRAEPGQAGRRRSTLLRRPTRPMRRCVPPKMLHAKRDASGADRFVRPRSPHGRLMPDQELLTDPARAAALLGLIEVRRYRGDRAAPARPAGGKRTRCCRRPRDAGARPTAWRGRCSRRGCTAPRGVTARGRRPGAGAAATWRQLARGASTRRCPDPKPVAETDAAARRRTAAKPADRRDALPLCHARSQLLTRAEGRHRRRR